MNKKTKKVLIIIFSIIAVILLFQLAHNAYMDYTFVERMGYYDFEKSKFKETIVNGNKIIEEKKLGLKMTIPKGWEYDGKLGMGTLLLKDPKINVESPLRDFKEWSQGCGIGIAVENDGRYSDGTSFFDDEINKIENIKKHESYCNYHECEIININEKEILKEVLRFDHGEEGYLDHVFITILDHERRKALKMNTAVSPKVPECQEHLDNFLNSLEIN
ncbi:MAG: hypothetical protein WC157_02420 [Candidatus Paceibacterota bacterium]